MEIRRKKVNSNVWPYLLVAPALIIMVAVVFYPICNALVMSFQNYNITKNKIGFIGLENYINVFTGSSATKAMGKTFWQCLLRTVEWVVFGVGGQFLFGFMLALILNKEFKGRGIFRSISLIPWVTPGVLLALMWRLMLDGNHGVINDLLNKIGILAGNVSFLTNKDTALPAAIVTIIWQGIPFFALMILAGLQGIAPEMYEAADIDGATGFQKLIYVTIPSLKNTIMVTAMLRVIWVANSVDVIWGLTEGGPGWSTTTLSVAIYKEAKILNMGYASALAVVLMLVLLIVSIPYVKTTFAGKD